MGALLPRTLLARTTLVVAGVALIFLAAVGASLDALVIDRTQTQIFQAAQRVATSGLGTSWQGRLPQPPPGSRVDLVQLVDARGRVLAAGPAAAGLPALTRVRPAATDGIRDVTECAPGGRCVMLAAIRLPPPDGQGEPRFLYAGTAEPAVLATHRLELLTAVAVLLGGVLVGWANWQMAGRSLRSLSRIREAMIEVTEKDLTMRVPQPPGDSEYAQLARTANQTLARLEETVRQQRRFASTASHELRTPLTALRARLEEAALYPGEVDPHDAIRDGLCVTDRMVSIVDDLLVLARLRAGESVDRGPVDLGALVTEEAAAHPGGVPVRVCAASSVLVSGNRVQLARVVDNLLDNARRHAGHRVEVTVHRTGDTAVVTVTDDGDGIAPQDRERIFTRFVRLDAGRRRDPGGSGLGLPISRDIAQAHSGTLRVEDSPRGARFVLRLPLMSAPQPSVASPTASRLG